MKIAIAGSGYVGLVTAACMADKGHQVVCVDVDDKRVEVLKKGICPIFEPGLGELIKKTRNAFPLQQIGTLHIGMLK